MTYHLVIMHANHLGVETFETEELTVERVSYLLAPGSGYTVDDIVVIKGGELLKVETELKAIFKKEGA